jgi:hypothetical protein
MHEIVQKIIDRKQAGDGRAAVIIAAELRQRETKDDLIAELAARDAHQANDELRRQIREQHLNDAPTLDLGQLIPAMIETKDGDCKVRELATVAEVSWHMAAQVKFHARRHGVADRIAARWAEKLAESEWDEYELIGEIRWGDKVCVICKLPLFDPDDPFVEWAHDRPISGLSGDDSAGWAHRHCNREEGAR